MINDKNGRAPIPITLADTPPQALVKELGADKISRNTAKFVRAEVLRKPDWIRVRLPLGNAVAKLKSRLRENSLVTVCEEASCPNIHECFSKGTATFMILGEVCTRRCSFCDVAHGRPLAVDISEPAQLAETIASMQLKYVVITSVDRDDLRDGGAQHYADCIGEVRAASPDIKIEILVPDFRGKGRMQRALDILDQTPPDVFNHNLETVAPLYRNVRPGADYQWSLELLKAFKQRHPQIPTKSGIMLGLGEDLAQVESLFQDLKDHQVDMITVGQYLQPTSHHHPVLRYWTPDEFAYLAELGNKMGFSHVASGPLVRSSYHADIQAEGVIGG
ncbi:MAG: lipoyl synthase [Xanthomonadales bacterium]|nr:lipoyl synthase [Xanthomonadales bacterium]